MLFDVKDDEDSAALEGRSTCPFACSEDCKESILLAIASVSSGEALIETSICSEGAGLAMRGGGDAEGCTVEPDGGSGSVKGVGDKGVGGRRAEGSLANDAGSTSILDRGESPDSVLTVLTVVSGTAAGTASFTSRSATCRIRSNISRRRSSSLSQGACTPFTPLTTTLSFPSPSLSLSVNPSSSPASSLAAGPAPPPEPSPPPAFSTSAVFVPRCSSSSRCFFRRSLKSLNEILTFAGGGGGCGASAGRLVETINGEGEEDSASRAAGRAMGTAAGEGVGV